MNYWRMAMKAGNQGPDLWPDCRDRGVAAIAYGPFRSVDLSRYERGEPAAIYKKLERPQRYFLQAFRHDIAEGDVIYAKSGTSIVGRGRVIGPYRFCPGTEIRAPGRGELPFAHQISVEWELGVTRVPIKLGAEPSTVLRLDGGRPKLLNEEIERCENEELSFAEGAYREITAELAIRSQALREAAIQHGTRCEVSSFSFEEVYGPIGAGFIEVHHLNPLSERRGRVVKTKLQEVATVCANCHRMLHRTGATPLTVEDLKRRIAAQRRRLSRRNS